MASRFKHRSDPSVPFIDLIWVDEASFALMEESSVESPAPLPVPMISFQSLLAMKLHALKDGDSRDHKDLLDIRNLLRYSPTKLGEPELRALCEKYAGSEAYDLIKRQE